MKKPQGSRRRALVGAFVAGALAAGAASPSSAFAAPSEYLRNAEASYRSGNYLQAARYAFSANEEDEGLRPEAYSWITLSLMRAGLPNAASYFFIRTLQSNNKPAIRRVLGETEALLVEVGGDLLRKYLIRHTAYDDYNAQNRGAYLYSLGKEALLSGKEENAIGYLNGIQRGSPLWPVALQLRASAFSIQGKNEQAIQDFRECRSRAEDMISGNGDARRRQQLRREAEDLGARCTAGEARALYALEKFDDADRTYDRIPKASIVWPDILFEQAWNSFARAEYNRTLGKLVSYKSPALKFVFNPEIDVLRAQSYLALCLYADANDVVNEFNGKYTRVGEEVKAFVEKNSNDLAAFHELGKKAAGASLYTGNDFYRMANRFVRSPHFQNLLSAERDVAAELAVLRRGAAGNSQGFAGFAGQVLEWRLRTIRLLGGVFVKNSLIDYHAELISNFEKMAFIKLEMLKQAKDKLMSRVSTQKADRDRGNVEPSRRSYQYYWSFNGEFWNDELGDYVFGLESECGKGNSD